MTILRPHDGIYLGDGEWLSWEAFGAFNPDELQPAYLPQLEWEARVRLDFPHAELSDIRQFIRLRNAASEYFCTTGRCLNVFGALGELYGSVVWGIRLNRKPNAQGSDGRLGDDHVEIKTIGPLSKSDRVQVKLSGNFNKLLVVKIVWDAEEMERVAGGAWWDLVNEMEPEMNITSRMVTRHDLTRAKSGNAGLAWSRACRIGQAPFHPP
ncbi:hypothetical protein HKCCE4037_11780 [Rhodobacterales bacterium HKCCE4037]|nr:hypothetical protein [Rhodobacterales bacterium HKCCE4037]